MKKNIPLSTKGIDELIGILKDYQEVTLEHKAHELAKRLADRGLEIANMRFQRAEYDGVNDVTVRVEQRSTRRKNAEVYAVVATGEASVFIEFGTGIHYGSPTHPEAGKNGFFRGMFGLHKGLLDKWFYKGQPGTHGKIVKTNKEGETIIATHGNRANMPMYITKRQLEEMLSSIASEVFKE